MSNTPDTIAQTLQIVGHTIEAIPQRRFDLHGDEVLRPLIGELLQAMNAAGLKTPLNEGHGVNGVTACRTLGNIAARTANTRIGLDRRSARRISWHLMQLKLLADIREPKSRTGLTLRRSRTVTSVPVSAGGCCSSTASVPA